MTPAGFPHSEISGSKHVNNSPKLIAAFHVLHRLPMPRHPPLALSSLFKNLIKTKNSVSEARSQKTEARIFRCFAQGKTDEYPTYWTQHLFSNTVLNYCNLPLRGTFQCGGEQTPVHHTPPWKDLVLLYYSIIKDQKQSVQCSVFSVQ